MQVVTCDIMDEERFGDCFQIIDNEIFGNLILVGGHKILDIGGRKRLADIVTDIFDQVFKEWHVAHSFATDYIFHKNCVINTLKILTHDFRIVHPQRSQAGQASVVYIFSKRFVVVFQMMKY